MTDYYNNSEFPEQQLKSPDMTAALSSGYDLGRKMYVNQQLPGLITAANNGDQAALGQAQAMDPTAAYYSALGNQATANTQQTKLLTVARLSNGLSQAVQNSSDDTSKQSAIDAFSNLAHQSGVPVPPQIGDSSLPMADREAYIHNVANQTQGIMTAATLGKGDGSLYIQQRIAQGATPAQAAAEWANMNPRNTTLPNGQFVQNSANGAMLGNPTTGQMTPMQGAQTSALTPPAPQMPPRMPPAMGAGPAIQPGASSVTPIDGTAPAVPISNTQNPPQPPIQQLASNAPQGRSGSVGDSVQIPQKPGSASDPLAEITQAKQASIQNSGAIQNLSNGGFMRDGVYYPPQTKANPTLGKEIVDNATKPFEDLDSEVKAAQAQILLAKQVQTISPTADSGEIADVLRKAGSTADSLGLLPGGSKASQDDLLKAVTAQYAAGIMGGENNVKNVRNVREFDTIMAQAPQLIETASGRDKISQLSQAVAQAKLTSAQQYQQAVADQTIANPDVKQALQDKYGQALDAIPVYGIAHSDDPKYASFVQAASAQGIPKQDIITKINSMAPQ